GARSGLGGDAERVGLVDAVRPEPRLDAVLVQRAMPEPGNEALPDTRRLARLERRRVGIPLVEVANHADRVGIRGPYAKHHPRRAIDRDDVRTQLVVDADVSPLVEEIEVEVRQQAMGCASGGLGCLQHWYPQR